MSTSDQNDWLRRIADTPKRVRFPTGIVGKTSYVMLALITMWTLIAWRISDSLGMNVALIIAGGVGTAVAVWWIRTTQEFAERNPAQAMLEGAEFMEYKRFEAEIGGIAVKDPVISPKPATDVIEHRLDEHDAK